VVIQPPRDFPPAVRTRRQNIGHVQFHLPSVKQSGLGFVPQSHHIVARNTAHFGGCCSTSILAAAGIISFVLAAAGCRRRVARIPCQIVSFKKFANLVIASLEHGNYFGDGPLVHTDGADTAHLDAQRSVVSTAVQTQQGAVPAGRPLGILLAAIDAPVVALQSFQQGQTGRGEGMETLVAIIAHLLNLGAGGFQ